jgi:L-aminopeptidase/D-esterase-like protein
VNRALPLSGNNELSSLTVSSGSLSPAFAPGTLTYTLDVASGVTSVTFTATKSDPNAVISGDVPNGGQATIPLDGPGTTKNVSITVTAPNGLSKTYTIAVTRRPPSSNNDLAALTVTPGSLSPGFSPNTLNYDVISSAGSLTVSATKADPDAVMSGSVAAGTGVPTGTATIPLGGPGTITRISIAVTAPNGVSQIYTITVSRPFR